MLCKILIGSMFKLAIVTLFQREPHEQEDPLWNIPKQPSATIAITVACPVKQPGSTPGHLADCRARLRKFPSLVNCCTIDWFSEWPADALKSVASQFLKVHLTLEGYQVFVAHRVC